MITDTKALHTVQLDIEYQTTADSSQTGSPVHSIILQKDLGNE